MSVINVTKDNFESEVLKSNVPVLADFNAGWCGPCRAMKPMLDELAEGNTAYKIVSIDIDEEVNGIKNKAAMAMIAKISDTCKKRGDIKWNFTKFLVDREGNVVKRFDPTSDPAGFDADIAALL